MIAIPLVLAAVAIGAGLGCVFMRATRREPTVNVEAIERKHRADKARLRGEHHLAVDRHVVTIAELAAERRAHAETTRQLTQSQQELATLRRAWEHGIDQVTAGDRPVVEHNHEEVA